MEAAVQLSKRLVVVNSNYPSETNLYGDVFVHSRLVHYPPEFEVEVCGVGRPGEYSYEGIRVRTLADAGALLDHVARTRPDAVLIHFVEPWMHGTLLAGERPAVVWVHGGEALGWYRRLWNMNRLRTIVGYPPKNLLQQLAMHRMVRRVNASSRIHFVFPSEWMRRVAERDALVRFANASIIPNPIDLDRFPYRQKRAEDRMRVLLLRSFESRKYATDVAMDAVRLLRGEPFFDELQVTVCGDGRFHERDLAGLASLPNVRVEKRFFEQREIPALHAQHGVYLSPTRQDAQGVSMCEAMASGLVPISSPVTAIPEFVDDGRSGVLRRTAEDVAAALAALVCDHDEFLQLSAAASARVVAQCGHPTVVAREVEVIECVTAR